MHDLSELQPSLIAHSDWNACLKCHNPALYSPLKASAGAQSFSRGLRKVLLLSDSLFTLWSAGEVHVGVLDKCVGSRINNRPSIIDGHILTCMRLPRSCFMDDATCERKRLLLSAPGDFGRTPSVNLLPPHDYSAV